MNIRQAAAAARALGQTGLFRPVRPLEYLRMAQLTLRWGPTLAAASAIAVLRAPHGTAVADEIGLLSWHDVDSAANAVADALARQGVGPETTVGLMCRNSRYFVVATLAVSKLGANLVLLNTDFGPHQLGEVLKREGIGAAVFDEDFGPTFRTAEFEGVSVDGTQIREAATTGDGACPEPPKRPGRIVIMTSGTTGLPKGAQRATLTPPVDMVVSAFSQLPLRAREPVVVAPPLFHLLGFGFMGFALGLQGTLVVQSRFDPEAVLAAIADHRATTLVAVPVMLRRILGLPEPTRRRYDTSSLRVIVCSGSSLSAELAAWVMDTFGDILYNFYGSTETGWATVAGPSDLRTAPGTVGRPPTGTRVAILDDQGRPVTTGQSGRIFVGSAMAFEGYTGGGGKQVVAGLMCTGDTGHFDEAGRLFVEGRDDEMIVSGGENVFPGEVEELLRGHEAVHDAAVVGIDDEELGQRLAAFVVSEPGSSLSTEEVKEYVRSRLARFKIPRYVEFVDEIPRNLMGKVLRRSLLDRSAFGSKE
ncbi:MAG TPA: AMP-binding protein [Acidimicrobiales bacterium]|nr:AMP-binding protein [Acidimicrobiales bacterium]HLN43304.1 AMP-binding protein [Acidimicrobiales bacterium]